jgi:hypothetical protein
MLVLTRRMLGSMACLHSVRAQVVRVVRVIRIVRVVRIICAVTYVLKHASRQTFGYSNVSPALASL